MSNDKLENRLEQSQMEQFIVAKTDEGYRVCSPLTPALQFGIRGTPDHPVCNCPDSQNHASDPQWRCKHILAVEQFEQMQNRFAGTITTANVTPAGPPGAVDANKSRRQAARNGDAQMLIKRSISPDGRIDSLSVEFSSPVGQTTAEDIKQRADETLKLQAEIVQGFLKNHGATTALPSPSTSTPQNEAVTAQLLGIAGMDGRYGRRLFINVLVNGQTAARLFGSDKQLAEALTAAGFSHLAAQVREGVQLNVPCRVVTRPNGKYVNIERIMPIGG